VHLKTLTIKGFKSFASSTTLRLEPGITAVVGPNGSGKSNVVDALTWVMGEQGAKNLRGGSMADVIFAGAGSRPALGRAEVSLTIDNTDGALPIDYTEVTISRTLFRGGGSEYRINGSPCRLLDVQELLSDTGLGRQMHVIVGQGQLDAVLSATPEDRRGFIEEAAGVLKHRKRKERALRKLESMAADLARVADLTQELRRQLGPLARQAAIARRARSIQVEVRDATARLLACLPVVGLGLGMLVGADPASLLLDGGLGSAVGALGIGLMVVGHLVTRRLIRAATAEGEVVDEALVLDLAAAALSAGASVPGVLTALGAALEEEDGAGVVGRALLLGAPWEEAWQAPEDDQWRARRSRLESCLRPGWEDGASPAALLAATAASLRAGRHARDEEAAERLAVRLVLPLGACHLPAFVILGIAPVVASVGMSMLSG